MARVKSWIESPNSRSIDFILRMSVQLLKTSLDRFSDDSDEHRRISFIIEQLKLLSLSKFSRVYSPMLLIMSYMIYAFSPAAYAALQEQNILCLPSTTTLKKVTRRLNSGTGLDNCSYLKMRISKLNQYERTVLLIIDEIYIAKRVEYTSGEMQGLTPDGSVASTLLCFMVKSLASKYKDLVAMYPIAKLTASKQYECYLEVAALLKSVSFNVVAISVDNATQTESFSLNVYAMEHCRQALQTP